MSNRLLYGVIAVGSLLLIAVVTVAVLVPGDSVTRSLIVVGYLIGFAKTAYDIWDKERERGKKAEDSKEKVQATAICRDHPNDSDEINIGTEIYNQGAFVNIRSVTLTARSSTGVVNEFSLVTNEREVKTDDFVYESQFDKGAKIDPKHNVRFFLNGKTPSWGYFTSLPPENLWISVLSFNGEVARITGDQIHKAINHFLEKKNMRYA